MKIIKVVCLGLLTGFLVGHLTKKSHVQAPTRRYHGYQLNHEAILKAKTFTVLISAEGFGPVSRGTGILLDPKHILTCAHVADADENNLWVYFYPGNVTLAAVPVYMDKTKDLAILEIKGKANYPYFPVFQETSYDGEPITIIGNALGSMMWYVGYGIVSGHTSRDLLTDGTVVPGDSGGPWINENGDVLALSDWGLETEKHHTWPVSGGISAHTINQFLKNWKQPSIISILMGNMAVQK